MRPGSIADPKGDAPRAIKAEVVKLKHLVAVDTHHQSRAADLQSQPMPARSPYGRRLLIDAGSRLPRNREMKIGVRNVLDCALIARSGRGRVVQAAVLHPEVNSVEVVVVAKAKGHADEASRVGASAPVQVCREIDLYNAVLKDLRQDRKGRTISAAPPSCLACSSDVSSSMSASAPRYVAGCPRTSR